LAGPAWACPMSADLLRGQVMSLNSGCLPRQTSGALIVTLLVTIQGTARALKHTRAPSRPGNNGGAQEESWRFARLGLREVGPFGAIFMNYNLVLGEHYLMHH
jgi:hypothetical protein